MMAYGDESIFSCLSLYTTDQYERTDSFLVLVPNQSPHGTLCMIQELCKQGWTGLVDLPG